jgi:DNA processing protein
MENGQNRSKMTDFEPSSAAAPSHLPSWFENMGHDPIQLDELLNRSGESAAMLQAQLLELELLGRVQRLPGNLYQQIGFA